MIGDCICPKHHHKDKDGYNKVKYDKRMYFLHRLIYELNFGKIESGFVIGHICNNKGCVNIHHLYKTTAHQNSSDAARDGLYRAGERHPKFKFTKELIDIITNRYDSGESQQTIADDLGVSQSRVSEIIRGNR